MRRYARAWFTDNILGATLILLVVVEFSHRLERLTGGAAFARDMRSPYGRHDVAEGTRREGPVVEWRR